MYIYIYTYVSHTHHRQTDRQTDTHTHRHRHTQTHTHTPMVLRSGMALNRLLATGLNCTIRQSGLAGRKHLWVRI